MNRPTRYDRIHIILIPGFGAFDALGQVEYYSGVTKVFNDWKGDKHSPVTLHYFDNLPTAAVTTRATKLRNYLAKRIARGEILEHDAIVLVGHSTGGLDIRQLIWDLHQSENRHFEIDSGHIADGQRILQHLAGVVFLSVPHWGTNIADWVHANPGLRATVVADLNGAVAGSQLYLFDVIESQLAGGAAALTDAGMLLALKDALTEANEHFGEPSPLRTADALEAFSELSLFFRQMWSDFDVIHDLMSEAHDPDRMSPAHFCDEEREAELKYWDHLQIPTVSYATVGGRAFNFPNDRPVPVLELSDPVSYADFALSFPRRGGNDFSYRLCYRACAGGPFRVPEEAGEFTRVIGRVPSKQIKVWDNDGIVNTASMLWPRGKIVLVAADHLDIVGHYELREDPAAEHSEANREPARKYLAYDCLQSTPRFTPAMFKKIWTEIFEFARKARPRALKRPVVPMKKFAAAA